MKNGKKSAERKVSSLMNSMKEGFRSLRRTRHVWSALGLGVILLLVAGTMAVLVNPSTVRPDLPLRDEDIGMVATADIRAPISFSVPDVEATERKRREAEDAVRSVYDFEVGFGQERIRRLQEAFGEMQRIVREHQAGGGRPVAEQPQSKPTREEPEGPESAGTEKSPAKQASESSAGDDTRVKSAKPTKPRTLADKLNANKGQFHRLLQVVVREEDFAQLIQDEFSNRALDAVSRLVSRATRPMIISRRALLDAERSKGITVRHMLDGVPQKESVEMTLARILELDDALMRVEDGAVALTDIPQPLRETVVRLAKSLVAPNLFFSRSETMRRRKEARDSVPLLETSIKKGAKIIRDGDLIEKHHIRVFREMHKLTEVTNTAEILIGTLILVMMMLIFGVRFAQKNIRKFRSSFKDLMLLALIMFIFVVSVKLWFWIFGAVWERFRVFPLESYYYAIPFATGAMLIRFILNSETALAFTAAASLMAGLLMNNNITYSILCLVSSLVGAGAVGQVQQKSSLFKAGVVTGLVNMVLVLGLSLFSGEAISFNTLFSIILAFSGGILSAVIVTGVAQSFASLFGYTTDIKLLELANLNHPLLKDLIVQAPGSYHHSIVVGSMVESAAEAVHCNPLLARVMAYYHDIGKIKNPNYFSENQRDGVNRHDKIKPSLSATVLKAHVKDGADLARASRLGGPIVDAITQHHGTSLIKFFYQRAKDQAQEGEDIKEADFRYPGPKPQTREVALVMLADSVEAAAKSISDPSPARLQGLVQNIINRIFTDGQLEECELTLKDLHHIARSFNRVLSGIYHHRPDYPEAATKERDRASSEKIAAAKKEVPEKPPEGQPDEREDIKRLGM